MEYQILRPKNYTKMGNTHFGTLYYDGNTMFKLNLRIPRNGRDYAESLFQLIANILTSYYDLSEPIKNRGTIHTGSSHNSKHRIRTDLANNDLYNMILAENPELKVLIDTERLKWNQWRTKYMKTKRAHPKVNKNGRKKETI